MLLPRFYSKKDCSKLTNSSTVPLVDSKTVINSTSLRPSDFQENYLPLVQKETYPSPISQETSPLRIFPVRIQTHENHPLLLSNPPLNFREGPRCLSPLATKKKRRKKNKSFHVFRIIPFKFPWSSDWSFKTTGLPWSGGRFGRNGAEKLDEGSVGRSWQEAACYDPLAGRKWD